MSITFTYQMRKIIFPLPISSCDCQDRKPVLKWITYSSFMNTFSTVWHLTSASSHSPSRFNLGRSWVRTSALGLILIQVFHDFFSVLSSKLLRWYAYLKTSHYNVRALLLHFIIILPTDAATNPVEKPLSNKLHILNGIVK